MTALPMLHNCTDEELCVAHAADPNPVVRELVNRLTLALDELDMRAEDTEDEVSSEQLPLDFTGGAG